ncbi:hypothetical protein [Paenibacillus validus]
MNEADGRSRRYFSWRSARAERTWRPGQQGHLKEDVREAVIP